MKICQQARNITFDKTAGELSALILESRKVKELQPIYNRKLRRISSFYTIHVEEGLDGILTPRILPVSEMPLGIKKLYGLFQSNKKAKEAIQSISNEHNLCYQACGIEQASKRACTSHQLKKCKGYCVGKQLPLLHNVKMLEGFSALALKTWPYEGTVVLVEKSQHGENEHHLLINNWCILGVAESVTEYPEILSNNVIPQIDKDIYCYLVTEVFAKKSSVKIVPLTAF